MSFTSLGPSDFVISTDSITAPAWSSNVPVLSNFYVQTPANATYITQNAFYLNVFQAPPGSTSASVQFAIAYGDQQGSGSLPYNSLVPGVTPSLTTYNQYNTLIYGPAVSSSAQGFNFGGAATTAQTIFAINVDRNRYKETLFPGTFNLVIGSGSALLSLTDNSNDVSTVTYLDCGRAYNIVSGSNGKATSASPLSGGNKGYTISGSYGLFLPDIGAILLNPSAIGLQVGDGGLNAPMTGSTGTNLNGYNNSKVFELLRSGSLAFASTGSGFQLNSQETISSDYVFVRIKNGEYNYTSNPSYISGSGNLVFSNFINNPQTYPTTVGMYNNNNELLAVAKMSKPLVKDFTKEALIRVKLDW